MQTLAIIGQVIFGLYWLRSGINHFRYRHALTGYAASKGVPSPKAAVVVSGLLLVIGGAGFLFGVYLEWAILALVVFLLLVTPKMHNFWTITDQQQKMIEEVNFMKNLALLAALLMLWLLPVLPYSLW
ncbi:MAG: DoxX family membrane protein [Candidatus Vogelbacteria bacterium]|nr:DoxX family membrane protein [Candidatus Vogelbacteria bacterium]